MVIAFVIYNSNSVPTPQFQCLEKVNFVVLKYSPKFVKY